MEYEDEAPYFWVDLNGTLCHHEKGALVFDEAGNFLIGKPINKMVRRVRRWLSEGMEVRIMSGSVGLGGDKAASAQKAIREWCREHFGRELKVTATITPRCIGIFNDKAHEVIRNTGRLRNEK